MSVPSRDSYKENKKKLEDPSHKRKSVWYYIWVRIYGFFVSPCRELNVKSTHTKQTREKHPVDPIQIPSAFGTLSGS